MRRIAYGLIVGASVATALCTVKAGPLEQWHWRSPSPFGNSMRSSCFGLGKFVAVGDGGIVHTSLDGLTWDEGVRPVTSGLMKVIFAGDRFLAVGLDGVIVTSPDGRAWTPQPSATTNALLAVAYGNGKYVAVGAHGQWTVSSNGSQWEVGQVGTEDLNWVTFGKGLFLTRAPNISSSQMAVRGSVDGQTWTILPLPQGTSQLWGNSLDEVAFGNGTFVGAGHVEYREDRSAFPTFRFFASNDGTNWTPGVMSQTMTFMAHRFLTFTDGHFYDFVQNLVGVTSDGTTDIAVQSTAGLEQATSLTFGNGTYLLTGLDGKVWTSQTGTNWTVLHGGLRTNLTQIIRGTDRFFAVGSGALYTSSDGLTFAPLPGSPVAAYGGIAFDGSNYVAVAEGGDVYTSTNGTVWSKRTSNTANHLLAICRGATRWAAAGQNGTIITSPNTLTWALRSSGTANHFSGIAFGNGVYVAVGDGGTISSSPDGASWEIQYSGTTTRLACVRFLNGQFFALGADGTILTSTDGSTWQARASGVTTSLQDITFGGGHYLIVGSINAFLQSTNGVDWRNTTTDIPVSTTINSAAFLDGSFWLCGGNGTIMQSDSVDGKPRLALARLPDSGGFQLKLMLNVPPTCRIQASSDLHQGPWTDVGYLTNSGALPVWFDTNNVLPTARFYRLAVP